MDYATEQRLTEAALYGTIQDVIAFCQLWIVGELSFSGQLREHALTKYYYRRKPDQSIITMGLGAIYLFSDHDSFVISGGQFKIDAIIPKRGVVITLFFLPQIKEPCSARRPYMNFDGAKKIIIKFTNCI